MLRVNGFYGHVRQNDLRSLAMFAGFAVAFQIVCAVALFVPLLFLDLKHAPFLTLGYLTRYAPLVFVLGLGLFAHRFLRHVPSVRASIAFRDVDRRSEPRLVNIVEATAIAAGLPLPKVGLIETSARNAFACGLGVSSAVVVVTRGLLDSLDDDELAAVIAHEIAHIKNGDIRLMAAANVLMDLLVRVQRRNPLGRVGWKKALFLVFMPALLILFGAAGFFTRVAFTIARVSRLLIASSREFVADAEAVRLTHNPAALISALRRIEGYSAVPGLAPQADAMMIDGAVEGPFATHPTVAERIAILMRLSGSMALADAPRRDTRPAAPAGRAFNPWNQPVLQPRPAAPAGSLVQRVNAGVDEDMFGRTKGARIVLAVGLGGMAVMTLVVMFTSQPPGPRADAKTRKAALEAVRPMTDGSGVIGGPGDNLVAVASPHREAQRLSGLHPVEARCFATKRYEGAGKRPVRTPDPALIEAYARGEHAGSDEVTLERYLGLKERTARALSGAAPADIDARLVDYVKTREMVLWVVHHFFGDAGLQFMRESYDSPGDRAIVGMLRDRLAEGAPALRADGKLARDMELLVSAPQDFVPCLARARETLKAAAPAHR